MKELYELKEMLCDELKEYGKKGELSAGSLDIVDKLSHALKSIETIIAMEESYDSDYSGNNEGRMYPTGRSYENRGRYSYARGRRGNVKRDSMGRYSRDGETEEELLDKLMMIRGRR